MPVCVHVIELKPGRAEGLELSADLRQHLPADTGQEGYRRADPRHVGPQSSVSVDKVGCGGGRQNGKRVDKGEMQSDREPGQPARCFDGARRCRRSDHQARSGEHAFDVGDLDRPVHFVGEAKIVGGDDQIFHCAVARCSRRKRKNSAPSRRRCFIISGLRILADDRGDLAAARVRRYFRDPRHVKAPRTAVSPQGSNPRRVAAISDNGGEEWVTPLPIEAADRPPAIGTSNPPSGLRLERRPSFVPRAGSTRRSTG
jgi:hypothetical protein